MFIQNTGNNLPQLLYWSCSIYCQSMWFYQTSS